MEKVVRVFHSFQEAEDADRKARANMSPEERVEIFFQLRERFYQNAPIERLARVYRVFERKQG